MTMRDSAALAKVLKPWFADAPDGALEELARARNVKALRTALEALVALQGQPSPQVRIEKADRLQWVLRDEDCTMCVYAGGPDHWTVLRREGPVWHTLGSDRRTGEFEARNTPVSGLPLFAIRSRRRPTAKLSAFTARPYFQVVIAGLLINFIGLLLPIFSSLIFNKVLASGHPATLWALTLGMLIFVGVEILLRTARSFSVEQLAAHADIAMERGVAEQVLAGHSHEGSSFSVLLSRYRNRSIARDIFLGTYMAAVVDLPFVLVYLMALLLIGGPIVLVPLVAGGLMLLGHVLLYKRAGPAETASALLSTNQFKLLAEIRNGADVWNTSPLKSELVNRWAAQVDDSALERARARFWRTAAQSWTSVLVTLSSVFVLVVGVYLIEAFRLNVGGLIACSLISLRAMGIVASAVGILAARRHVQETQEDFEKSFARPLVATGLPLVRPTGELLVRKLGWSYPGSAPLFRDLDLKIAPGEKIALVGAAGSGKSTLLRCLAGLLHPSTGDVLIDGISVKAVAEADRLRWLSYKRQEPAIIAGTLYENLGGSSVDRDRLLRIHSMLGLGVDLGFGTLSLDRMLSSDGGDISGGQRQLIELARAMARDAAILLLDEPTAGLDAEAEQRVIQALQELSPNVTTVMATHSAPLVGFADRVIVLGAGGVLRTISRSQLVSVRNGPLSAAGGPVARV